MPRRIVNQRTQTAQIPAWLTHYQRTGKEPPEGTPEWQECSNWLLLAGYARHKGWPEPSE